MAQYLFALFVDPVTPQPFLSYLLSQLFGLSPRELELRKCIIGTPGCMAFCCYLIFPWKKKGEPKRRECYTVYLLDSKILPLCCLLCWTSLNWFMGHSGRETCTKNLISANTNQEGIESVLMLMPYPCSHFYILWYQFCRHIIFKREEARLSSSLLNIICRQIWYQSKSDYMDRA